MLVSTRDGVILKQVPLMGRYAASSLWRTYDIAAGAVLVMVLGLIYAGCNKLINLFGNPATVNAYPISVLIPKISSLSSSQLSSLDGFPYGIRCVIWVVNWPEEWDRRNDLIPAHKAFYRHYRMSSHHTWITKHLNNDPEYKRGHYLPKWRW